MTDGRWFPVKLYRYQSFKAKHLYSENRQIVDFNMAFSRITVKKREEERRKN